MRVFLIMADLVTSHLDSLSFGENGTPQHAWSSSKSTFEDSLVALDFQCVRQASYADISLSPPVKAYADLVKSNYHDIDKANYLISFLARVRDIHGTGKGEYALFHNMILAWDNCRDADHCVDMVRMLLTYALTDSLDGHGYGSWKDAKYILNAWKRLNGVAHWESSLVVRSIVELVTASLMDDSSSVMLCKWLPREKSRKFGWQATIFASQIFPDCSDKAALTRYRKLIASTNVASNTTQVLQCDGRWSDIDFSKDVTSITMHRQRHAFACNGSNTDAHNDADRMKCADNYNAYITSCLSGNSSYKSSRLGLDVLCRDFIRSSGKQEWFSSDERKLLDLAWAQQNQESSGTVNNWVTMLDTSSSMEWENCPLYAAMGLALRIAEQSILGPRVMTFATRPSWIDLSTASTFCERMSIINSKRALSGTSTNFASALELIAEACVARQLTPSEVESLVLCVLSDMQIDNADTSFAGTMDARIKKTFMEAGLRSIHAEAYPAPTIVYWNMRTTTGMPCAAQAQGVITASGYSPAIMGHFTGGDTAKLRSMTPWTQLEQQLNSSRYRVMWS